METYDHLPTLLQAAYLLDEDSGVWHRRHGAEAFAYTDGEVELWLQQVLGRAADLSCGSEELRAAIFDWPSRYHLDPRRANLLRPLRHLLAGRILELGAGCGALTRYLGETASQVVAVEGAARRAHIARLRCTGLPNVEVVCDNAAALKPLGLFHAVTLIGVLEYSPHFVAAEQPMLSLLRLAAQHLRPDGVVIVAIENQLGLKYFAGAYEDHHNKQYYGLEGAYAPGEATTLGRLALSDLLAAAGYEDVTFLFPLPDYKLPQVVISAQGAQHRSDFMQDILGQVAAGDQSRPYARNFSEECAWPEVLRNGLVEDLANSFLLVARPRRNAKKTTACVHPQALAYTYSESPRCFSHEMVALPVKGRIYLRRCRLFPDAPPQGQISQTLVDSWAVEGPSYARCIKSVVQTPGWRVADLATALKGWESFLRRHVCGTSPGGDALVAGDSMNCMPWNLVQNGGTLTPMSRQWQTPAPVELCWVLWRGLSFSLASYESVAAPHPEVGETLASVVPTALRALGYDFDEARQQRYAALEQHLFGTAAEPLQALQRPYRSPDHRQAVESLTQQLAAATTANAAAQMQIKQLQRARFALRRALGEACARSLQQELALGKSPVRRLWRAARRRVWARSQPERHLASEVARHAREPASWFDAHAYQATNPDVVRAGIDPLMHYMLYGWREGRSPSGLAQN